jgi:manganese transport protein
MLFNIPIRIGACIVTLAVLLLVFRNAYKRIETIIIGFVSIIGLSFIYELTVINVDWKTAASSWVTPAFPDGSIVIIMSVLGAVVMPHNIFLHSEVIQSRQWNLENESVIRKQLKYEFLDTLFSMGVGWAINSAMIIVAAATFNAAGIHVEMLEEAKIILVPLLGNAAAVVFAFALLCSGIASSVTAAIAGGSIFAGMYNEPFDIKDNHSRTGVGIIFALALVILLFVRDTFQGLVISQVILSVQLPFTIFLLIMLTSSKRIMGTHANSRSTTVILCVIGGIVSALNIILLVNAVRGFFR